MITGRRSKHGIEGKPTFFFYEKKGEPEISFKINKIQSDFCYTAVEIAIIEQHSLPHKQLPPPLCSYKEKIILDLVLE
jgi:hypothetical protein